MGICTERVEEKSDPVLRFWLNKSSEKYAVHGNRDLVMESWQHYQQITVQYELTETRIVVLILRPISIRRRCINYRPFGDTYEPGFTANKFVQNIIY